MEKRKKDVALVLSSGGLAGTISAGFVATICRELGIEHFSIVYCYSVGALTGTFGVANQPDTIEDVWRNHVDGNKVYNLFNLITFGLLKVLRLNYLKKLFSEGSCKLDKSKVFSSKTKLKYVLIEKDTGRVRFISPKKNNILDLMSAACAIPVIHGPYEVDGIKYLDVNFICGNHPSLDKIIKKHDHVVFVSNFPKKYIKYTNSWYVGILKKTIFPLFAKLYPRVLQEKFKVRYELMKQEKNYLEGNSKITLLNPKKTPLRSGRDSDKVRLNGAFDEGVKLAKTYIKSLSK